MTSALQNAIRELLRETGPSTTGEILDRQAGTPPLRRLFAPRFETRSSFFEEMLGKSAGSPTIPRRQRKREPVPEHDDHLYAFFMSGRASDGPMKIEGPFGDAEPPTADEVTLAELGLSPGQKFLYLFDFGDDLRHQVEMLETFSPAHNGQYPRISESHGKAPQQYSD